LKKAGKAVYRLYMGTGILAVGVMTACVIYAVIARYFFGVSHTFLEEFITTVFAFTTFWGIGICVVENEHVVIDALHALLPAPIKKAVTILDYLVVLLLLGVMVKYGGAYALRYGKQISMGMRVPMIWMYGIIPLSSAIASLCVVYRIVVLIRTPVAAFKRRKED
jgi:TRAP-type C4-dicarboxylate transport system permease small subunit